MEEEIQNISNQPNSFLKSQSSLVWNELIGETIDNLPVFNLNYNDLIEQTLDQGSIGLMDLNHTKNIQYVSQTSIYQGNVQGNKLTIIKKNILENQNNNSQINDDLITQYQAEICFQNRKLIPQNIYFYEQKDIVYLYLGFQDGLIHILNLDHVTSHSFNYFQFQLQIVGQITNSELISFSNSNNMVQLVTIQNQININDQKKNSENEQKMVIYNIVLDFQYQKQFSYDTQEFDQVQQPLTKTYSSEMNKSQEFIEIYKQISVFTQGSFLKLFKKSQNQKISTIISICPHILGILSTNRQEQLQLNFYNLNTLKMMNYNQIIADNGKYQVDKLIIVSNINFEKKDVQIAVSTGIHIVFLRFDFVFSNDNDSQKFQSKILQDLGPQKQTQIQQINLLNESILNLKNIDGILLQNNLAFLLIKQQKQIFCSKKQSESQFELNYSTEIQVWSYKNVQLYFQGMEQKLIQQFQDDLLIDNPKILQSRILSCQRFIRSNLDQLIHDSENNYVVSKLTNDLQTLTQKQLDLLSITAIYSPQINNLNSYKKHIESSQPLIVIRNNYIGLINHNDVTQIQGISKVMDFLSTQIQEDEDGQFSILNSYKEIYDLQNRSNNQIYDFALRLVDKQQCKYVTDLLLRWVNIQSQYLFNLNKNTMAKDQFHFIAKSQFILESIAQNSKDYLQYSLFFILNIASIIHRIDPSILKQDKSIINKMRAVYVSNYILNNEKLYLANNPFCEENSIVDKCDAQNIGLFGDTFYQILSKNYNQLFQSEECLITNKVPSFLQDGSYNLQELTISYLNQILSNLVNQNENINQEIPFLAKQQLQSRKSEMQEIHLKDLGNQYPNSFSLQFINVLFTFLHGKKQSLENNQFEIEEQDDLISRLKQQIKDLINILPKNPQEQKQFLLNGPFYKYMVKNNHVNVKNTLQSSLDMEEINEEQYFISQILYLNETGISLEDKIMIYFMENFDYKYFFKDINIQISEQQNNQYSTNKFEVSQHILKQLENKRILRETQIKLFKIQFENSQTVESKVQNLEKLGELLFGYEDLQNQCTQLLYGNNLFSIQKHYFYIKDQNLMNFLQDMINYEISENVNKILQQLEKTNFLDQELLQKVYQDYNTQIIIVRKWNFARNKGVSVSLDICKIVLKQFYHLFVICKNAKDDSQSVLVQLYKATVLSIDQAQEFYEIYKEECKQNDNLNNENIIINFNQNKKFTKLIKQYTNFEKQSQIPLNQEEEVQGCQVLQEESTNQGLIFITNIKQIKKQNLHMQYILLLNEKQEQSGYKRVFYNNSQDLIDQLLYNNYIEQGINYIALTTQNYEKLMIELAGLYFKIQNYLDKKKNDLQTKNKYYFEDIGNLENCIEDALQKQKKYQNYIVSILDFTDDLNLQQCYSIIVEQFIFEYEYNSIEYKNSIDAKSILSRFTEKLLEEKQEKLKLVLLNTLKMYYGVKINEEQKEFQKYIKKMYVQSLCEVLEIKVFLKNKNQPDTYSCGITLDTSYFQIKNPYSQEKFLDDNIDNIPTSAREQNFNKQKHSRLQNINQQLDQTLEDINLTNTINQDQEQQQKIYSEQSQGQKNQDQTISLIVKDSIQDNMDEDERLCIQIEQENTSIRELENYSNETQENDNQNEFQLNSNFQRDNPIEQVLKTTFIISTQYNKIKYVIAMINTIFLAAAFSPFMVIPTEDLVENCYKICIMLILMTILYSWNIVLQLLQIWISKSKRDKLEFLIDQNVIPLLDFIINIRLDIKSNWTLYIIRNYRVIRYLAWARIFFIPLPVFYAVLYLMIPPKQNKTLEEKVAMQLVCVGYIWLLISIGSFITFLIIIFYYVPKSLLKSKLISESNDDGVRAQLMNYDKYLDKYQNVQKSREHIKNCDDLIQDKISYKSFFPFKKKKIQKLNQSIKKDVVKEQLEQQLLQKNYPSDKGYNIQRQMIDSELNINKQIYKQNNGSEMNNLCSICLEIFEYDNKIIQLPCHYKHIFHQKCIKNWWKTLQACPICRSQFKGEYFFGNSIFPKQRLKQLRYCLAIQIDLLASKAL